jgi:hypothetical protein
MHKNYFEVLLLLARHKVLPFAEPKTGLHGQYDVCYDLPAVYNSSTFPRTRALPPPPPPPPHRLPPR